MSLVLSEGGMCGDKGEIFYEVLSKITPSETDKITTKQAHIGDQEMEK